MGYFSAKGDWFPLRRLLPITFSFSVPRQSLIQSYNIILFNLDCLLIFPGCEKETTNISHKHFSDICLNFNLRNGNIMKEDIS